MCDIKVKNDISILANRCREKLQTQMVSRMSEMESDNNDHYLIYKVLGISLGEGKLIDEYQNKGNFLEEATLLCFESKFPDLQKKCRIENKLGTKPKTFEINCLVNQNAYEIKWRDATTDGDHITKEHTRAKSIAMLGYTPIRIMFYYPNRTQAIRI